MNKRIGLIILCLGVLPVFSQEQGFMKQLSSYLERLDVFEQGQEPPRTHYLPTDHQSLNGSWKFYYSETPEGIPDTFFQPDFDDRDWASIPVPSNWEMQGFGDKLFRNISTTYAIAKPADTSGRSTPPERDTARFTVIPPEVPDEYNPSGAYRKTFFVPQEWEGKEVFLRFEKIASAFFVWVNGQEVGYNEGAQEPLEYNITPYLVPGKNTLALLVVKFSDGYYLEGQDYWRLAGIFDDAWLYATPKLRLFDWQVLTDLDEAYRVYPQDYWREITIRPLKAETE